jgi:dephospho-CoA kinase
MMGELAHGPGKIPLIGIVGGIASGKSFIAEQFRRQGAAIVSADQMAHEVLKNEDVKRAARERWGDAIFGPDGQIDRAALGNIVFAPPPDGPRELKVLEQWTHPRIGQLVRERVFELARQGTVAAMVLDVPLMFESGWNKFCDKIVFVDATRPLRVARAACRGWTEEDFSRREAAQESLETKRALADVVIDNSGSPESAQAQIEHFWHSLVDPSLPQ